MCEQPRGMRYLWWCVRRLWARASYRDRSGWRPGLCFVGAAVDVACSARKPHMRPTPMWWSRARPVPTLTRASSQLRWQVTSWVCATHTDWPDLLDTAIYNSLSYESVFTPNKTYFKSQCRKSNDFCFGQSVRQPNNVCTAHTHTTSLLTGSLPSIIT